MKGMHNHPRSRIKILKSLVVTKMQRKKFHFRIKGNNVTASASATASANANDRDNGSTRTKRGNQFPRKLVGSVLSGVLGNKTSLGTYPLKWRKKNEPQSDSGDGKEWHITRELGNNLVCGDEQVVAATALSQLLTLEETLETDGKAAGEGNQNRKDKQSVKMNITLLSFLEKKKKGWNSFIKAKTRTIKFSSDDDDDVINRFGQVRRKASSSRLVRIPSKIPAIHLKLKMVRSLMRKKVTKQFENSDEDKDTELCKKRILMGVRCKPLSSSGSLRYDEDGLILPDIVP